MDHISPLFLIYFHFRFGALSFPPISGVFVRFSALTHMTIKCWHDVVVQGCFSPHSTELRRPMKVLSMMIWKMLRRIILKLGPRNPSSKLIRAMKSGRTREMG